MSRPLSRSRKCFHVYVEPYVASNLRLTGVWLLSDLCLGDCSSDFPPIHFESIIVNPLDMPCPINLLVSLLHSSCENCA